MLHVKTVSERLLAGEIQPPTFHGLLAYMGIAPPVAGSEPSGYEWALDCLRPSDRAAGTSPESLIPINAKFGDDFVMHVVMLAASDTMASVARKVARHTVGKRIPAQDREMVVYSHGRIIPTEATVAEAAIAPYQHVFVDYAPAAGTRTPS